MNFLCIPQIMCCRKCSDIKSILEFTKDTRATYGYKRMCKKCEAARARQSRSFRKGSSLQQDLSEAPFKAIMRLLKLDPTCLIAAASANKYLFSKLLKEEREKVFIANQIKYQSLRKRPQSIRERAA